MNKKLLVASVAGVLGGMVLNTANAATVVSPSGIGQTVLVPYFTAQGGNATLINIVNTDSTNAKIVKVRFRGAEFSDDVFDFTLFLSPNDVFTGAVSQNAGGGATFSTSDKSCTLPASVSQDFVTSRVASGAAGTLEGYVEIFIMADLVNGAAPPPAVDIWDKVLHSAGVAPCGITNADITALGLDPSVGWPGDAPGPYDTAVAAAAPLGIAAPTPTLMANSFIVDGPRAAGYGVEATALVEALGGPYHVTFSPQLATQVPAGRWDDWSSDQGLADTPAAVGGDVARAAYYDLPDLSTQANAFVNAAPLAANYGTTNTAIADVSAAIASRYVANEFLTDSTVAGATDWVFSMPTRRYYMQYVPAVAPATGFVFDGAGAVPIGPYFTGVTAANEQPLASFDIYDREEQTSAPASFVISPGVPGVLNLTGEVGVIGFNGSATSSEVLSAKLTLQNVETAGYADGWMAIDITGGAPVEPVIGFAAIRASNNPAGGDSFNYGAALNHRFY